MTPYLAVPGTWSFDGDPSPDEWSHPKSEFADWMRGQGLEPVQDRATHPVLQRAFAWSGRVDGVIGEDRTWQAEAEHVALRYSLCPPNTVLWLHSHAGNLAIEAARIVPIRRMVTICTPVQPRLERLAADLVQSDRIGEWWHVHASGGFFADRVQALGSMKLFDGVFGWRRRYFRVPGVQNVGVRGIDHSRVLHEYPQFVRGLVQTNVLAFARGERWFSNERRDNASPDPCEPGQHPAQR